MLRGTGAHSGSTSQWQHQQRARQAVAGTGSMLGAGPMQQCVRPGPPVRVAVGNALQHLVQEPLQQGPGMEGR